MRLKTVLLLSYTVPAIIIYGVSWTSLQLMIVNKQVALLFFISFSILLFFAFLMNYAILSPIFRSIHLLTVVSQKATKRKFATINEVNFPLELKELTVKFNEMLLTLDQQFKQLEETEQEKDDMIANLSHDIKTPITSIRSMTQAIQDKMYADKDEKELYLDCILKSTYRVDNLVNNLMQLSDLKTRQLIEQSTDKVWIDKLLVHVLNDFNPILQKEHRKIDVHIDSQIKFIYTNELLLMRVLYNLVDNAIKYSKPDTLLSIVITNNQSNITICITDEGMGIPPAEQSLVFDRFYRVDKSRNLEYGGSGLGLYICKQILSQLEGEINIVSSSSKGTSIQILLPFTRTKNMSN